MNERIGVRFERLEAVRRRVESRIDGVAHEALNRPEAPGQWSVAQVISHIVLAETRTVGYVTKKKSDPSQLRPAGMKERLERISTLTGVPAATLASFAIRSWVAQQERTLALIEGLGDAVGGEMGPRLKEMLRTGLFARQQEIGRRHDDHL